MRENSSYFTQVRSPKRSLNASDQVEFLLGELNESSQEINNQERLLSDAISRRTYLMESISGPRESTCERTLYALLFGDPVARTCEYFRVQSEQECLKQKIQRAADDYRGAACAYEKARNTFDSLVDKSRGTRFDSVRIRSEDQFKALSETSVEVLAAQGKRDESENVYLSLMHEFDECLARLNEIRRKLGSAAISQASSFYEKIQLVESQIRNEDIVIDSIVRNICLIKDRYKGAMLRLEELSNGIHYLQQDDDLDQDR